MGKDFYSLCSPQKKTCRRTDRRSISNNANLPNRVLFNYEDCLQNCKQHKHFISILLQKQAVYLTKFPLLSRLAMMFISGDARLSVGIPVKSILWPCLGDSVKNEGGKDKNRMRTENPHGLLFSPSLNLPLAKKHGSPFPKSDLLITKQKAAALDEK